MATLHMQYVSALPFVSKSYSEVASSVRLSLLQYTEDHTCLREAINTADFKQTHLQHVMHYYAVGFYTYTIPPPLSLLFLLYPPPFFFLSSSMVGTVPHTQHQASPHTANWTCLGDLIRDLLEATAFYTPSSNVFPEVSYISSLSLSSAQLNHPLLIFGWLHHKSIPSGKAEEQLSCCHQLISQRCYYTPPPCQCKYSVCAWVSVNSYDFAQVLCITLD